MAVEWPRLRLERFEAVGLFDSATPIVVEIDPQEPTILTGSNGTGKSTILRSIESMGTAEWSFLARVPFDSMAFGFAGQSAVRVTNDDGALELSAGKRKTWRWDSSHLHGRGYTFPAGEVLQRELLHRLTVYPDAPANVILRGDDLVLASHGVGAEPLPDWLQDVTRGFAVLYVTDQRLVVSESVSRRDKRTHREQQPTRSAAEAAATGVARAIGDALKHYGSESARIDRDMPLRLSQIMDAKRRVSDREVDAVMEQVRHQRSALQSVGLLSEELGTGQLERLPTGSQSVRPLLLIVAEGTLAKLQALEPLRTRLGLFADFLNRHYRPRKEVIIDEAEGFRVVTTPGGRELSPSQLSSGEQQILVLAHQILFVAQPGTLLLVDEPELSLHVTWQSSFVDDLSAMAQLRELQLLMATHSPTLIGGRRRAVVSLDR